MSLNKKVLAAAVAGALFAPSAFAAVSLTNTGTNTPVTIASERVLPATFANNGDLDLRIGLGYALSNGEVRYARVECSSNVKFNTAAVTYTDATAGNVSLGAVNGLGTSAIYFSVTADSAGVGDNAGDVFTINGTRDITSAGSASCTYGLYDQPSQASAGGTTGRIALDSGNYIRFASGYAFTSTGNKTTADVESSPAFSRFVVATPTNSNSTAQLANVNFDAATNAQLDSDGNDVTLADIFGANTAILVAGDFSAAANADGTFNGAALARVQLEDNANCGGNVLANASSLTAGQARFTVGSTATAGYICFTPRAGVAIPAATYTATLSAVAASGGNYAPASTGPLAAGEIDRNGTQLQAPFAQVPGNWISRMVLTNTGTAARPYTIQVTGEEGNVIGTANLTGTVPANGTKVVDLKDVLTSFSGAPRATLNVNVAGPSAQIQGLYQIVNPDKGSISNHVMVRPNTN